MSVVIAVLLVIQFFLAVLGWTWAPLGFLHSLNAIAIAAVGGILARTELKGGAAEMTFPAADA
jgi:hypothetical protein